MAEDKLVSANVPVPPEVLALMEELTEKTGHAVLLIPVEVIGRFCQACGAAGVEPIDLLRQVLEGMAAAIQNGVPSVRFDLYEDPEGKAMPQRTRSHPDQVEHLDGWQKHMAKKAAHRVRRQGR